MKPGGAHNTNGMNINRTVAMRELRSTSSSFISEADFVIRISHKDGRECASREMM
jgi:hypothetical protein